MEFLLGTLALVVVLGLIYTDWLDENDDV